GGSILKPAEVLIGIRERLLSFPLSVLHLSMQYLLSAMTNIYPTSSRKGFKSTGTFNLSLCGKMGGLDSSSDAVYAGSNTENWCIFLPGKMIQSYTLFPYARSILVVLAIAPQRLQTRAQSQTQSQARSLLQSQTGDTGNSEEVVVAEEPKQ
ncbi:hypothetical protein Tco_1009486, partial [Tanacetum coccineum]